MIIHVVQPGETLNIIAGRYGIDVNQIIEDNELQEIPYLVVGQALVVDIGEMPPQATIEANGYIVPSGPDVDIVNVRRAGEQLTYVTPSSYDVREDGSLSTLNDEAILQVAREMGIAPLISVSNLREGDFDPDLARAILVNTVVQDVLFGNMLNLMEEKGYYGVNINFERVAPADRDIYNTFIARAVDFFHQYNIPVSTALAPKTYDDQIGEWWGAHDYETQGQLVDFVVLMTYDWGCVACPPMAIAPANEIRTVLDYAVSVMPREKILMGVPLYGFDWRLPFVTGQLAQSLDTQRALERAGEYNATILYDEEAEAPYFYYTDETGVQHIVWFEDARSFQAKFSLVVEYGLRGISYWALGFNSPQAWPVQENMFDTVKIT